MRQHQGEDESADKGRKHGDDGALGAFAGSVAGEGHPGLGEEQRVPERAEEELNQGGNQNGHVIEVQMMHGGTSQENGIRFRWTGSAGKSLGSAGRPESRCAVDCAAGGRVCQGEFGSGRGRGESAALECFEFIEGARPVGAEQAGEAAVGQHLAARLAAGAVVGFVVGIADALDHLSAARAGLVEAAVDRHSGAKGVTLSGNPGGLRPAVVPPITPKWSGWRRRGAPLLGLQFVGEGDGERCAAWRISSE